MKPINILLIEDSEGDIMLITEALEEGRIANQVTVMKNGWEAIQYLEKKGNYRDISLPDLILLDVNLPKLNGHEVLKKIKSNENTKHIPVIILTTSSEEKDVFEAYKNHANCFISKPVLAEDFLKVVISIEDFWIAVVKLPRNMNE
ncbi:response regulator [Leptospira ilyithenensis]|uniref:Response regulator n=1 Tax=Leptospira ilyithenensis TaxID=2484901 RepID=A0A4V3JWZ2_9LEPT|nr:response regulator [Leptospira ilyithenensis]TGN09435.1 response regulator [Leptospira ilyithenensis]